MIFIFGGELCASSKNVFITRRDGGMLAIEFLSSRKKITIAFIVVCCWFRARRCFSFRLHCICSIRSFKGGKECYLIAGENNENFYVSHLRFYFLEAFIGIVILEILVIKLSDGFLSTSAPFCNRRLFESLEQPLKLKVSSLSPAKAFNFIENPTECSWCFRKAR